MAVVNLFIIFLAVLGIYFLLMSRIADQITPAQQGRHLVWFTLGLVAVLAIFIPSPDLFGPDYRFTVSMGQLMLAIDVGPLLLFQGIPMMMLKPLLRWKTLEYFLTRTLLVGFVSSIIMISWHVPFMFEAASRNFPTWILKELMLLFSGLLLWWPVDGPLREWRPAYPIQLVYLFTLKAPMVILGSFFTFANGLIYTSRSFALEICAPSSISDQQVGGLLMALVGGMIGLAALTIVFFNWLRESNQADLKWKVLKKEGSPSVFSKKFFVVALVIVMILTTFRLLNPDSNTASPVVGDPAAGEVLFNQGAIDSAPGCLLCHTIQPNQIKFGPSLAGIAKTAETRIKGKTAEEYLRDSILDPNAYVPSGYYPDQMYQKFRDVLTEKQMKDLIAYLLTLN